MTGAPTAYALLGRFPDRSRPLITHYSGPTARVELSVATAANAVAKAAGLLRDGLALGCGARVSIDLPPHWQLPVWVLAALSAGCACSRGAAGPVDVRIIGPSRLARVAGSDPRSALAADEVLVSACDAFGGPVPGGVPPGLVDLGVEVRGYPDVFAPDPDAAESAMLDTQAGAVAWLDLVAAGPDVPLGARLWVDASTSEQALLEATAVRPLLAGGSVVIASGLEPAEAARIRTLEGVSARP